MPRLFLTIDEGLPGQNIQIAPTNRAPLNQSAQPIDPSDVLYPAPGGGLLRVPVGGGAAAQLFGTASGELVYWDAAAGQWVATATAPTDGQIARWNAATNTWDFVPEPNLGAINYLDTTYTPVGLWNFNGTLADQSGNGNTLLNAAGQQAFADIVPGKRGLYCFLGSRYMTGVVALLQLLGDMTIVAIAQQDSSGVNQTIARCAGSAAGGESSNTLYSLDYEAYTSPGAAPRSIRWNSESGAGVAATFLSAATVSLPPIHNIVFLAARRQANVIRFYVNGLPFGADSAVLATPTGGGASRYVVGASQSDTTLGAPFVLFSNAVYNTALSDAEIKDLYNRTLGPAFGRLP